MQGLGGDRVLSVSELNSAVKELLAAAFPQVTVQGEISGLHVAASGHSYFDLKDQDSVIAAVMFKGYAAASEVKLANGLLVTVKAEVGCYVKQGKYQLIVKSVQSQSLGELHMAFERLKAKLMNEGLFEQSRKRPIPDFPRKVGVVTSASGAAVRDIISVLRRRNSGVEVLVAPVLVQGAGSKEQIAQAIVALNANFPDLDVLLVGRGGGSMEDLWAFNEEIVARAIAASKIPVISCVWHETDFTIADFVADLRAPTPSAAAELVSRSRGEMSARLESAQTRLLQALRVFYERTAGRYARLLSSRAFKNPESLWLEREQALDGLREQVFCAMDAACEAAEKRLGLAAARLSALSPKAVLGRGFAIVRGADGAVLKSARNVKERDAVRVQLRDGGLDCEVKKVI
ncbi:MAG: exodeoxyribonuclease VII large subunit [Elusimicrobia bacterium]|nr:exodeoxyribonuclease VII large subunit [Elusimicrobiota bacterium]